MQNSSKMKQIARAGYIRVSRYTIPILPCLISSFLLLSTHLNAAENETWMDDLHGDVSESINASANWIDSFFGKDSAKNSPEGYAKIRLGYVPIENEFNRFESKLKLRLKLPKLEDKWDLIISDYDDTTENDAADEALNDLKRQDKDELNVALRLMHSLSDKRQISSRIGLAKGKDIFFRTRLQQIIDFSPNLSLSVEPAAYYYLRNGWGARFDLDFEYKLSSISVITQNNSIEYIQDNENPEWQHNLLHYFQVNPKSAFITGVFANGYAEGGYQLLNKGVFVRFRYQTKRKWLYFEIEPFVHYPEFREFDLTTGIALRVEGNFGY